jgi:hypothetical protein
MGSWCLFLGLVRPIVRVFWWYQNEGERCATYHALPYPRSANGHCATLTQLAGSCDFSTLANACACNCASRSYGSGEHQSSHWVSFSLRYLSRRLVNEPDCSASFLESLRANTISWVALLVPRKTPRATHSGPAKSDPRKSHTDTRGVGCK